MLLSQPIDYQCRCQQRAFEARGHSQAEARACRDAQKHPRPRLTPGAWAGPEPDRGRYPEECRRVGHDRTAGLHLEARQGNQQRRQHCWPLSPARGEESASDAQSQKIGQSYNTQTGGKANNLRRRRGWMTDGGHGNSHQRGLTDRPVELQGLVQPWPGIAEDVVTPQCDTIIVIGVGILSVETIEVEAPEHPEPHHQGKGNHSSEQLPRRRDWRDASHDSGWIAASCCCKARMRLPFTHSSTHMIETQKAHQIRSQNVPASIKIARLCLLDRHREVAYYHYIRITLHEGTAWGYFARPLAPNKAPWLATHSGCSAAVCLQLTRRASLRCNAWYTVPSMTTQDTSSPYARRTGVIARFARRCYRWRFRLLHAHRHGTIDLARVHGLRLLVLPEVFHPEFFFATSFFLSCLERQPIMPGLRVLEIGTGSGALAVYLGQRGVEVCAIDINPQAVRCARANVLQYGLEEQVRVLEGDLFAPVAGEQFDVILFNPPFYERSARDMADRAWTGGPGNETLWRFLADAPHYMSPGGQVLVTGSTEAPYTAALRNVSGYHVSLAGRRELIGEQLFLFSLRLP